MSEKKKERKKTKSDRNSPEGRARGSSDRCASAHAVYRQRAFNFSAIIIAESCRAVAIACERTLFTRSLGRDECSSRKMTTAAARAATG